MEDFIYYYFGLHLSQLEVVGKINHYRLRILFVGCCNVRCVIRIVHYIILSLCDLLLRITVCT